MSEARFHHDVTPRPVAAGDPVISNMPPDFPDASWLPDELVTKTDWDQAKSDSRRRQTLSAGDPVSAHYGNPEVQIDIQARENAARRLGLYGVEGAIAEQVMPTLAAAERIKPFARRTPLEPAERLSAELGCQVLFKREDQQVVHSFKVRGAANFIAQIPEERRPYGVLTASAGNHAQGVALAARELSIPATVVMPSTTPEVKVEAVRSFGAHPVLHGDNYSDANDHAQKLLAESPEMTYVPPFDDPEIIAGQGTIAKEILDDRPDVTHIFVPVGGGGLVAGIAQYVKSVRPEIRVIGVEPDDSDAMKRALAAGEPVELDAPPSIFAEGVAVQRVGELTYALTEQYADEILTVSKADMSVAMDDFAAETRGILEPAGALAIAGAKAYARHYGVQLTDVFATICSGANISRRKLGHALEQAERYRGKEALFQVELAERPGSLYRFCELVDGHNITVLQHRLQDDRRARVLFGFTMADESDRQRFLKNMKADNYRFRDVSDDEFLAGDGRNLFGGIGTTHGGEHFFRISLPERSGALKELLAVMGNRWNISLFQYQSYGDETGDPIIGFESGSARPVAEVLRAAGYHFANIDQAVFRSFSSIDF